MNQEGTCLWLDRIVPAPLEFKDVDGHRLAMATLDTGESLVATTDFADTDTGLVAQGLSVRSELLTVARAGKPELARLVIEAAELLIAARVIPAQPGTLLPKLGENTHGMLIAPFLWNGPTPQLKEPDRWTLILQLVALNDAEYAFAVEEGVAAFQEEATRAGIDLLDFTRVGPQPVD
ncbi:hypothetical protein CPHO_00960 [Corynebacterium phocae]|uniref:Uncharacterized protein n=1 Tax=Corynebacterium phocae TaxID=161895 RepID=A0A1L7D0P8_9CORY|nr:suppressor of fused domain protein [Corynebacterium phocae]APT91725.1 hypothetical protein CPHO_00960 [Corynebacterium phocae]KAA8728566.1 suppressor of fused domain protein [Corynebacterium phocae]